MAQWNLDFMARSDEGRAYMDLARRVDEALQVRVWVNHGHTGAKRILWILAYV